MISIFLNILKGFGTFQRLADIYVLFDLDVCVKCS